MLEGLDFGFGYRGGGHGGLMSIIYHYVRVVRLNDVHVYDTYKSITSGKYYYVIRRLRAMLFVLRGVY